MEKLNSENIKLGDIVVFVDETKGEYKTIIVRHKETPVQIYGLEIEKIFKNPELLLSKPQDEGYIFVESDTFYFRKLNAQEISRVDQLEYFLITLAKATIAESECLLEEAIEKADTGNVMSIIKQADELHLNVARYLSVAESISFARCPVPET